MTKQEILELQELDRVEDSRDGVKATVLGVTEDVLRVRYDDSTSSNYIYTNACEHLAKAEVAK